MANFEIWPPRSDINFDEHGPGADGPTGSPGFFSQQLRLNLEETTLLSLDAQPSGVKLVLKPREQNIVKIEKDHEESLASTVFKFTGLGKGQTRVEAMFPETPVPPGTVRFAGPYATLFVSVRDPSEIPPNSDFVGGFIEGLSKHKNSSVETLKRKLLAQALSPPEIGEALMIRAFQAGLLKGLMQGLQAFLDMLKGVANFAFDTKFRDQVMASAQELIGPWTEMIVTMQGNPSKFLAPLVAKGNAIGKTLGEQLGQEINDEIAKKSALELCEWAGKFAGLVMFEVVLQIAMDLIGIGAVQAARWIGEGTSIVGRLLPKLRGFFTVFEDLKAALASKLAAKGLKAGGRGGKAVDEGAEALRAALKAAEDLEKGPKQLPPHIPRGGLRPAPANAASYGETVVEPEVLKHFLPEHLQMSAKAIGFDTFEQTSVVGTRVTEEGKGAGLIKIYEERIKGGTWTTIKGVSRPESALIKENIELALERAATGLKLSRQNQFERIEGNIAYRTVYAGPPDKIEIVLRLETGTPAGYEPGLGLQELATRTIRDSVHRTDIPAGIQVFARIVRFGG